MSMLLPTPLSNLKIFLAFLGLILIISCDSIDGEPVYLGYEYFALDEGKWLVYKVDSIVYDDFLGQTFHYNYHVKEVNSGLFADNQGNEIMRIERFYRENAEKNWQIKNVWTATLQTTRATKTEENVTFVKLVFPLKRNLVWNGNSLNNISAQNYRIIEIHTPHTLNGLNFDSTLTVLQRDFSTLIGEDFQQEMYAAGVGLIMKRYKSLSKEVDGTIIRGVDYSYELLEYGFNSK